MTRYWQVVWVALLIGFGPTTIRADTVNIPLVTRGAAWKYLDTGTDQGTAWRAPGFVDSTWASGPAPLGFGDTHIVTTVNGGPTSARYPTIYFRKSIVVNNAANITGLSMNVLRDDGAVIYINGTEVVRTNMPTGTISYSTWASTGVATTAETTYYPLTPSSNPLVDGTNVIAVEVHQVNATSSDLGLDLDLTAQSTPVGEPPSVQLMSPAQNSVQIAPATVLLSADAADTDGTVSKVEFYSGTTKIGEDTTAPYSLLWNSVPVGMYDLTAIAIDNSFNPTTSTPVRLYVNATTGSGTLARGPYLQRAAPASMVIRWRSSQPITGRVQFGATPDNLSQQVNESAPSTEHIVQLTGLSADTTYYYSVGSAEDTLAGGDADFRFTTPPVPGTTPDTRVWVLGDPGTADSNQQAVRDAFYNFTGNRVPNLWLMLGDNAYDTGTDAEYQAAVFDMYPTLLRKSPIWPTLGNHETAQATAYVDTYPYFNIFTLPKSGEAGGVPSGTEHYYSFNYGNIHFICLDSMTASRLATGPMAIWLLNDLAATTATWIIAFWHHPPYTKGSHNSHTETELIQMRENFLPILEQGGVDLVLCGHSHSYERSYLLDGHYGLSTTLTAAMKKNGGDGRELGNGAYVKPLTGPRDHFGAVYAVAGSSGKTSGGTLNHPAMYCSLNQLGSMVLDISGTRLDATFLRSDGSTPDTFTMIKRGAADSDGDGIPDEYELANGLDRKNSADALQDLDADGTSNMGEFLLGLHANVSDRYSWTTTYDAAAGAVTVSFPTLSGRTYQVWRSNDLQDWQPGSGIIMGTGQLETWTDTGVGPPGNTVKRFYRVQVTFSGP